MSSADSAAFNRGTVLAMVLFGFAAFIALLYFLGSGSNQRPENDRGAHALANGLNGYAGLAELLRLDGYEIELSRSVENLSTPELLVLTPPDQLDPEELSAILSNREYIGPTLVILPKWSAFGLPPNLSDEQQARVQEDWVQIDAARTPDWARELDAPFAVDAQIEVDESGREWMGSGFSGTLPDTRIAGATVAEEASELVRDGEGRALAYEITAPGGEPVTFIIEPDLVNNYGLSDPNRAALALNILEYAGYGRDYRVTFDLTLNGMGGKLNLLTLAFQPPFLAATLCLMIALLVVGWRAFCRFGSPAATRPDFAYGKSQLVINGAGLILRARRFRLLAEPFALLSARRIAARLGLRDHDPQSIDAALASKTPEGTRFSDRRAALIEATSPSEILRAANALREFEGTIRK